MILLNVLVERKDGWRYTLTWRLEDDKRVKKLVRETKKMVKPHKIVRYDVVFES